MISLHTALTLRETFWYRSYGCTDIYAPTTVFDATGWLSKGAKNENSDKFEPETDKAKH